MERKKITLIVSSQELACLEQVIRRIIPEQMEPVSEVVTLAMARQVVIHTRAAYDAAQPYTKSNAARFAVRDAIRASRSDLYGGKS